MSPGCITYHNKAFPLGIIKANLRQYDVWLSGKLINATYHTSSKSFDLIGNDLWGNKQGFFDTQTISVMPEIISNRYIDVTNLLQFAMQSGYYITGAYNEYYIPRKKPYKAFNFIHDYILIGFDDSRNKYFSAGYIDTQRYELFEIEYSDYLQSICGIGTSRINLWLHKMNQNIEVKFSLKPLIQHLENYINSVYGSDAAVSNDIYGLNTWLQLSDYVGDPLNPSIDMRYARLFMEHKEMMLSRLHVLQDKGFLSNEYLDKYSMQIVKPAKTAHYLCLKYNLTHDINVANRAHKMIKDITDLEYILLVKILQELKIQGGKLSQ